MFTIETKEEAFKKAQNKAQETGSDYRVIELENGKYKYGLAKRIALFYPHIEYGWTFRYRY